MGFLDKLKGIFGGAKAKAEEAMGHGQQQQGQAANGHGHDHAGHDHAGHDHSHAAEDESPAEEEAFDVAGFDAANDEESFFNAVLHMESEGMFGGTDESRAEISSRFGIRDRSHWQTVKESVYSQLARKHGSFDEVSQREMNWRQGEMQKHQQGVTAKAAASGELNPVEGITLEAWAAINAAIVGGASHEDLLKSQGIDKGRWERVSAEWNARMSRDTTFAITTVYGNAFQAASKGKYGDFAREANAARGANRDVTMEPPMSVEAYWELLYEQDYGSKQGKDPIAVLKGVGLTVVDWTDLSTFMGYYMNRTIMRNHKAFEEIQKRVEAKFAAKYPGVKTDVDIAF